MTHSYVMHVYDRWRGDLMPGDTHGYILRVLGVFAGTVVVSLISRYVLELPVLSLRRRVLSRPAPKAETEEPLFAE